MKKLLISVLKIISFLFLWIIGIKIMPTLNFNNLSLERLYYEIIPFLILAVLTIVYIKFVEKNSFTLGIGINPKKSFFLGIFFGTLWIGTVVFISFVLKFLILEKVTNFNYFIVFTIALAINTIMQELLVRGYPYLLIKNNFGSTYAIILTSIIFTAMHGFNNGILSIINVFLASIIFSLLLEYSNSLLVPIVSHFIWNLVGGLIFGVIQLGDYPSLFDSKILVGGKYGIEGSFLVTIINIISISILYFKIKQKIKPTN